MANNQESPDGESSTEWNDAASNSDSDTPSDETEPVEAEVVEDTTEVLEHNPDLTPEVEALSTFSEEEGPLSFRIIPVIEDSQTDWRLVTYLDGTQGPVYQSRDGLTDEAREQFGVSTRLQERINAALQYARENLEIPASLGNQTRAKKSLHELELLMED
ncbi:hypothetical protein [Halobacterium zhouii]|uniref:hypothetical protein n=1 Tax=Halobacterium zhouii TaxID=2902624 RepID=UPI001E60A1ED|nr:hypothetical protein [Halobacterium zhouii]